MEYLEATVVELSKIAVLQMMTTAMSVVLVEPEAEVVQLMVE